MEYFTRAWASGDLSEEATEEVEAAYTRYLASIEGAGRVWTFATRVSLHDAWVDRIETTATGVTLRLLTGDGQRGYHHTEVHYRDSHVLSGNAALQAATVNRPTEIWYDEFSGRPPTMMHRFLLIAPGGDEDRGEVHIAFSDLAFTQTEAADRALPAL